MDEQAKKTKEEIEAEREEALNRERAEGWEKFDREQAAYDAKLRRMGTTRASMAEQKQAIYEAQAKRMRLSVESWDQDEELKAIVAKNDAERAKTREQRILERARIPTEEEALREVTKKAWKALVAKCTIKNSLHYRHWGGLGIKLHDEWEESLDAFIRDVGLCPSPQYELKRIALSESVHFVPGNVVWMKRGTVDKWREEGRKHPGGRPKKGQAALLEWKDENGVSQLVTMPELAKLTGIKLSTIRARYTAGKTVEQIINPVRANANGEAWVVDIPGGSGGGVTMSLIDLCRAKNIPYPTVKARILRGIPLAQALLPKAPKQTHEERKAKQRAAYHAKKAQQGNNDD